MEPEIKREKNKQLHGNRLVRNIVFRWILYNQGKKFDHVKYSVLTSQLQEVLFVSALSWFTKRG